jgi:hypothetical protein
MDKIYCILDMCGTKQEYFNLIIGLALFFIIMGIGIYLRDKNS